ncbi:hypothetical protein ACMD2_02782 [Ananas comosus]|uniref:Uncharacterized protein n=1 Tax=Ananas comosus TaxID=4615 RepID=A0A199V3K6_ANACO|nr:hypothetical protein ACMD2_02782 [Ananas comosus]
MAQNSTTRSSNRVSSVASIATTVSHHYQHPSCGLGRLIRKLKKQSKLLCMTPARPRSSAFHCQYDPLSYARNFDRSGFGTALDDDSTHFYYTFSSRFVAVSSRVSPSD